MEGNVQYTTINDTPKFFHNIQNFYTSGGRGHSENAMELVDNALASASQCACNKTDMFYTLLWTLMRFSAILVVWLLFAAAMVGIIVAVALMMAWATDNPSKVGVVALAGLFMLGWQCWVCGTRSLVMKTIGVDRAG